MNEVRAPRSDYEAKLIEAFELLKKQEDEEAQIKYWKLEDKAAPDLNLKFEALIGYGVICVVVLQNFKEAEIRFEKAKNLFQNEDDDDEKPFVEYADYCIAVTQYLENKVQKPGAPPKSDPINSRLKWLLDLLVKRLAEPR